MESSLPPRLKELLYQLSTASGQIAREVETLMAASAPETSPLSYASNGELGEAAERLAELHRQITEAESRFQERETENQKLEAKNQELLSDFSRCESDMALADGQYRQLLSYIEAATAQTRDYSEERRRMELERAHLRELSAGAQAEEESLRTRRRDLAREESALGDRAQLLEERERVMEGTRYWLESLLPVWLKEEGIAQWREMLLEDAQHLDSPSSTSAGLLFATFSLYTYAQRDTDARAVADALRDLGRRLFGWLKERGEGDYQASTIVHAMTEHINRECAGRCELEVPIPGAPAQNQSMLYQPRPGGSAQSVISVQSWCVRGPKREVIHRAAVTV